MLEALTNGSVPEPGAQKSARPPKFRPLGKLPYATPSFQRPEYSVSLFPQFTFLLVLAVIDFARVVLGP